MPTAEAKQEPTNSQDGVDPFGKAVAFVKYKMRYLEQRKKNLEQLKKKLDDGREHELQREQILAVDKLPEVQFTLGYLEQVFARLQQTSGEIMKLDKQRRQQHKLEKSASDQRRFQRVLVIQDVLNNIDDRVRADLLEGRSGAPQLSEQNLQHLDDLFRLVTPSRGEGVPFKEQMSAAAEHLMRLADYSQKKAPVTAPSTTYDSLARLIDQLAECGVLDSAAAAAGDNTHENTTKTADVDGADVADDVADVECGGTTTTAAMENGYNDASGGHEHHQSTAPPPLQDDHPAAASVSDVVQSHGADVHHHTVPAAAVAAAVPPPPQSSQPPPPPQQPVVTNIQFLQDSELNHSDPSLVDPAVVGFSTSAAPLSTNYQQQPQQQVPPTEPAVAPALIETQTFTNSSFTSQQPAAAATAAAAGGTSWADEPDVGQWGSGGGESGVAQSTAQQSGWQQEDGDAAGREQQDHMSNSGGQWSNSNRYDEGRRGGGGGRYRGGSQNGYYSRGGGGGRPYRGGGGGGFSGRRGGRRGGGPPSERGGGYRGGGGGGGGYHRGGRQ